MPSPERRKSQTEQQDHGQEAIEALAERLHLHDQYLAQIKVLYQTGLLENFPVDPDKDRYMPEQGIVGVDGQEYSLPSYEDILNKLKDPEKRKIIEKKAEQGFTQLRLVPFALPLSIQIQRYKETLLKVHQESGIKATDDSTLELNTEDPLYIWQDLIQCDNPQTDPDKQMEYQVTNYDGQTKDQRGGKYKSELLKQDPSNAWQFLLLENLPDLPAEGKGQTINGRKQFEANQSPKDYLKALQTNPQYQNEQGLTPEAALSDWLTHLQEDHTAIDDYQGKGKANYLVGQFVSGRVPAFDWRRNDRQPNLGGGNPDRRDSYDGFRSVARL